MSTTTPNNITESIKEFAKNISSNSFSELQYINVTPENGAKACYSASNVKEKILKDGGDIQYGWIIWQWDRFMLEAEFHAVWKKDGKLIDITPTADGEDKILFLPDYVRKYEGKIVNNIRYPLIKNPMLDEYISIASKMTEIRNRMVDAFTTKMYGQEITELNKRKNELFFEITGLFLNVGRNDRCPCGSGLKYKKCCGL